MYSAPHSPLHFVIVLSFCEIIFSLWLWVLDGRQHSETTVGWALTNLTSRPSSIPDKMNLTQQIAQLTSSSTDDLNRLLHAVQSEISKRKNTHVPGGFTEYIPDLCSDSDLLEAVWKECESFDLASDSRKASTQWLCSTGQPYVYADAEPVHEAADINSYPNICKLLDVVNSAPAVDGPLDSCLVLKYCSDKTRQSLHSDNEALIDQSKSICAFCLGSERTLEFWQV